MVSHCMKCMMQAADLVSRQSYKHCMQAETAGFGADNVNAGTTVITTVASTADAHVRCCETSICTLLFRSYRFATRMPSTRCRRHATSPATSAVAMRCFTITSNHQFKKSQTMACSNSTQTNMSRTYDHGTGKVNLGKLHASWMADETDCAVSERSEYMPSLESANKHMAGRSRTDHVGALLGSNIIHNTFMSSSAAGVVL